MDESQLQQATPKVSSLSQPSSTASSINGTPASSQRTSTRSSPTNIPAPSLVSRPTLNQYLKIAVIRSPNDVVLCDDPERPGTKREVIIGSLSDRKEETTKQQTQKTEDNNKRHIPVPTITTVKQYRRDVQPNFEVPQSYIRYNHPSYEEVDDAVEYNIDEEDENWWKQDESFGPESKAKIIWEGDPMVDDDSAHILSKLSPGDVISQNPRYYMSPHGTYWLIDKHRPRLPLPVFEQMMDVLEKATGFETIVTVAQAENILSQKIPMLSELFSNKPPVIEKRRHRSSGISVQSNDNITDTTTSKRVPAFAPPISLSAAIFKVYNYWMQKRSRLKKPLIRRFWPATSTTDINPHMVFRPRDKEKRKLRKKRQNDVESYRKMKLLKLDFEKAKTLCDLIVRREGVTSLMVDMTDEYYQQRLHEWLDTNNQPRQVGTLTKEMAEGVLDIPKYFDDGQITLKSSKNKKRKRSSALGSSVLETDHLLPQTVSDSSAAATATATAIVANEQPKKNVVVAGHDGGLPAPSFLDHLPSREAHVTNWSNEAPLFLPCVENGKVIQSIGFQHRARMGRGGRIMIDRIPNLSKSISAPKVFTYGSGTSSVGYHTSTLGADGEVFKNGSLHSNIKNNVKDAPKGLSDLAHMPLDNHHDLSKKIERICAKGIIEDSEQQPLPPKGIIANDEIFVPLDDFLDAPPGYYGDAKYVIGPL